MKLIVGLGNPGREYKNTRHNAGFMAIDKISSFFGFQSFAPEKKFNSLISSGEINGVKTFLIKPQTYMNNSGLAVKAVIDYYNIPEDGIIVIQDELDLLIGNFKISKNRSSAGHKGVQSIIDRLGTQNFTRYRIGIDAEKRDMPSEKFVLSTFNKDELSVLGNIFENVCSNLKKEVA